MGAPVGCSRRLPRSLPAAPAVPPDVWRRLGPAFPNGSHEVTVLIKVRSFFLAAPVKFACALLLPENGACQEAAEGGALPKEPFGQRHGGEDETPPHPNVSLGQNLSILAKSSPAEWTSVPHWGCSVLDPTPVPTGLSVCLSIHPQPLSPQDARGKILGYAVVAESSRGTLLLCNTSSTICSILVPPGARVLHVTAHNSKGASSPASITLNRSAGSQEGRSSCTPTAVQILIKITGAGK